MDKFYIMSHFIAYFPSRKLEILTWKLENLHAASNKMVEELERNLNYMD